MSLRLAVAALLISSIPLVDADAFIFRRLRDRISSASSSQSRGFGLLLRRRSRSSSSVASRSASSSSSSSGPKWNVEGRWNYSQDFIARHLREVHDFDPAGMTKAEMTAAHNKLHNGQEPDDLVADDGMCPCCGQPLPEDMKVTVVEEVKEYELLPKAASSCPSGSCPTSASSSSRSSSRSSSCPSGNCPTSTRRRGLFRR